MLSFKDFLEESKKKKSKQYNPIKSMDYSSDNIDTDEFADTPETLDNRVVGK
jgi:hypothetical protein